MRFSRRLGLLAIAGLLMAGAAAQATYYSHRQYYTGWYKQPAKKYYYRTYYYKPTPTYTGYKHHYAVYYPEKPKHYYYYNPYKKQYWGRCPLHSNGEEQYSILPESERKASIDEIPESAFAPPGKNPPIPESKDGATLDLPPDEPPPDTAALPVG